MNVRKKVGYVFTMFAVSLLAICFFSIKANAMEISENGKYYLVLSVPWDDGDADIDGEYEKLIRFNVDPGETTVDITELTKGITAFNGKNVFEGWRESDGSEISLRSQWTLVVKNMRTDIRLWRSSQIRSLKTPEPIILHWMVLQVRYKEKRNCDLLMTLISSVRLICQNFNRREKNVILSAGTIMEK